MRADKKTSKKGREIDKWYSAKAHEAAGKRAGTGRAARDRAVGLGNVLPGSTHDLTAAREFVLPQARPYLGKLPVLADSGYEGAGVWVHARQKPARGELDIDTKTRNALLRSLRYQGERGFALMSQRWRAIQHVLLARPRSATSSKPRSSSRNSSTR